MAAAGLREGSSAVLGVLAGATVPMDLVEGWTVCCVYLEVLVPMGSQ